MKKCMYLALMLASGIYANAQEVTVPEPEFINSYCILTSDSTYAILPKEQGSIGKHQNKVRKWGKLLGGAASIAGAAGGIIGINSAANGSFGGTMAGVRMMGTSAGVGSAANAVSGLADSAGMDIVFKGGHSSYAINSNGQAARLLIKGENNNTDPMDSYRIVRFNSSKKERRIQWMEFESALIGSEETKKAGYVPFEGHKYGEQSYILTIPTSELEKGEYGIFYMSIVSATTIPVGTFSVK